MKKVFLDTSVFIRFLTKDNVEKYDDCQRLLEQVEAGKLKPYISNIVVAEIIFVLDRQYRFPKRKVIEAVEGVLQLRNLTAVETSDSGKAFQLYKKHIVTYDHEFGRIAQISATTPTDYL